MDGQKYIPALLLYLKLRLYAKNRAGYFTGYTYVHRERYLHLPLLRKLGLVEGFKIKKHRWEAENYCKLTSECYSTFFTKVSEQDLISKSHLSVFLTGLIETYIRKIQDIKAKHGSRVWDSRDKQFVRKRDKKQGQEQLDFLSKSLSSTKFNGQSLSFISRSMVKSFRSISNGSISKHRKILNNKGLTYYLNTFIMSDSPYSLDPQCTSNLTINTYYSKSLGKWIKRNPTACTSIIPLSNLVLRYLKTSNLSKSTSISIPTAF